MDLRFAPRLDLIAVKTRTETTHEYDTISVYILFVPNTLRKMKLTINLTINPEKVFRNIFDFIQWCRRVHSIGLSPVA